MRHILLVFLMVFGFFITEIMVLPVWWNPKSVLDWLIAIFMLYLFWIQGSGWRVYYPPSMVKFLEEAKKNGW